MKDLLNNIIDLLIWLLTVFIVVFIASSVAVTVAADEPLTPDERIVALTILGEARGEGKRGMYAVGCVIQKRAAERKLTPARVCLQPYQFSIWNAGKGKIKKESELYYLWKSKSMMYARELARKICDKNILLLDITKGANHYCTQSADPNWTKGRKPVIVIRRHKFFRLGK